VLHILMHCLDAEPEDRGDLPIGFPAGKKSEALSLPAAKVRPASGPWITMYPPRDVEGVGANEFGAMKGCLRNSPARRASQGA
jgi:hypothetical protein